MIINMVVPIEIISEIAKYLHNAQDYFNLRLTCKMVNNFFKRFDNPINNILPNGQKHGKHIEKLPYYTRVRNFRSGKPYGIQKIKFGYNKLEEFVFKYEVQTLPRTMFFLIRKPDKSGFVPTNILLD